MICADASNAPALVDEWRKATRWDVVVKDDEREKLERVFASAKAAGFPGAILPWPRIAKPTVFYGVAALPQDWRRLCPLLVAFGGPTLTTFSGLTVLPEPKYGAPEAFLARQAFAGVARLVPKDDSKCRDALLLALNRLCTLVLENPAVLHRPSESTNRLLGRLEGALADGDKTSAMALYDRLRSEDRLDGLNLRYLSIQIAAAFRDWQGIAGSKDLNDLVASPRPRAVSAAILEAIYAVHVEPDDKLGNPEYALAKVRPMLEDLLASPRPVLGAGAARLAALFDEAAGSKSSIPVTQTSNEATVVAECFSEAVTAKAALIRAMQSESLVLLAEAIDAVERIDAADRDRLLSSNWVREMWREALARSGTLKVPTNWAEWFALLDKPEYTVSIQFARTAASEWNVEEQLSDPASVIELASLFGITRDRLAEERLADALPIFVNWLRQDPAFPRTSFAPLYDALWTLLVLSFRQGTAELECRTSLFDALLASGVSRIRYKELLQEALEISGEPGRRTAYWILGLVELTAEQPTRDSESRDNFWAIALSRVDRFRSQLSVIQRAALNRLAKTLGLATFDKEDEDTSVAGVRQALSHLRVAVYTLTESAGNQALDELKSLAPGIKATLHTDHVGSAALKSAAENADVFVIVTCSAKHAATDYIRRHRPQEKATLFAPGRGASAILRVVDEYLNL